VFVVAQSSGSDAIAALVVIAAGLTFGSLAAAVARNMTSSAKRPEALRASSGAIATLFFSVIVIIALVIALGIVNEAALTKLSEDVVSFLPKVLSATIVLIVGNIIGAFLEAGVARSLGHVTPAVRDRVPMLLKALVTGFAVVIAANQLGVDTTIISIAVAAIFFSAGLSPRDQDWRHAKGERDRRRDQRHWFNVHANHQRPQGHPGSQRRTPPQPPRNRASCTHNAACGRLSAAFFSTADA